MRFTTTRLTSNRNRVIPHPKMIDTNSLPNRIARSGRRLASSVSKVCRSRSPAKDSAMVDAINIKGVMKDTATDQPDVSHVILNWIGKMTPNKAIGANSVTISFQRLLL